jgi:hypothetical protein
MSMTPGEMFRMLHELRQAHRDLDQAIAELEKAKGEELAIKRLKKRKLVQKDQIAWLEDKLIPDEPA